MARVASLIRNRAGATIVEFAIVLPVLVCLLMGVLGYGQYFLLAHSVQQIANDAARATVAGLDPDERKQLAETSVTQDVSALGNLPRGRIAAAVNETGDAVAVDVTLDAHGMALFTTSLVPMPSPMIERRAVVLRGGLT